MGDINSCNASNYFIEEVSAISGSLKQPEEIPVASKH